jgi:hypothetical protein
MIILTDTTCRSISFGVIVFKDSRSKCILWRKYVERKEMVSDYPESVKYP